MTHTPRPIPQTASLLGGILVGGRSSRMGACKAMLQMPGGKTLLDHVSDCAMPFCQSLVIATAPDQTLATTFPVVADTHPHQGPATGIASVLRAANDQGQTAAFVLSVDLPALTTADLAPLVDAWRIDPTQITTATTDREFPEPLVAIYPTTYLDELIAVANCEDRSVTRWLRRTPHQMIDIRGEAIQDVDTPEQWQAFYERASSKNSRSRNR